MDALLQDLRFALRSLRKHRGVTVLAILSLALAIGGNTVVFSLVNGLLYRPLPYPEPHRVLLIGEAEKGGQLDQITPASAANFLDWRERQHSFSGMAGFAGDAMGLGGEGETEQVNVGRVSPELFPLLGGDALVGRVFLPEEATVGNEKVVVLSHPFWREHFGAANAAVGEILELDGEPYTVVGVLPEEFEFLDPNVRLWRPLALEPGKEDRQRRELLVVARLAPGVEEGQARAEMRSLASRLEAEYPEANRGYTVSLVNLREQVPDSRNRQLFALLQGALIFVLLIACANLANLLLARGRSREREIAVRSSLGAGSHRIARQLLTESLVLAGGGGLAGLGLGALGTRLMAASLAPVLPKVYSPVIDARVVAFTVGLTVLAGLLFGVMPAFQSFKLNLVEALKDGARGSSAGPRRRWLSNGLVVAEIAMALVLLGGATLLIRSFLDLQYADPGFETANLLTVQMSLPAARYDSDERIVNGVEEMASRLAALPGVAAAVASSSLPRSPFLPSDTVVRDDVKPADGDAPARAEWMNVTPGFFEALGIPLQRGRLPERRDRADGEAVAVINQAMAERLWPEEDPLGKTLTLRGRSWRIVGVVGNVLHGFLVTEGPQPTVYLPLAQLPLPNVNLILRTRGEPVGLRDAVRQGIRELDPDLALSKVQTLEEFLSPFFVGVRVFTTVLGGFGCLALLLAMLGTYGVLAYAVALRTHEIGVRMALGAERTAIVAMVTRQGLRLAGVGILLGLPGVWVVTRLVERALADLVPVEPLILVAVAAVLALVTVVASLLPARRAASVDPVRALSA